MSKAFFQQQINNFNNLKLQQLKEEISKLSLKPAKISVCETVINPQLFVDSHVSILEANSGKKTFLPYYNRLLAYYKKLKDE